MYESRSPPRPPPDGAIGVIAYKFSVGQVVEARASPFGLAPPGRYEILRLLPPTGASNQYRLKSLKNGYEWVVREEDIFREAD